MNKYYVVSGILEIIVLAESPQLAAMEAYDRYKGTRMDLDTMHFFVDERGFRDGYTEPQPRHRLEVEDVLEDYYGEYNSTEAS